MNPAKPTRILALCDSPALRDDLPLTGFGRVARNLFGQWISQGFITPDQLDVWAINFSGHGYRSCDYKLYPAGTHDWCSAERLQGFINLLATGRYTHVWLLMDMNVFSTVDFVAAFRGVCKLHGIRSMLYFPVDAPVDEAWTGLVQAVDVPVSYTEYGRADVRRAMHKSLFPIEVLPHGMDDVFTPLTPEERADARDIEYEHPAPDGEKPKVTKFLKPGDLFIVSVNKNEWRKDPLRSLEILKGLRESYGVPAKLLMRMQPKSGMGGCDLETAARQLGLKQGEHWFHSGPLSDMGLRTLYGSADLYLTTTTGEGWGLGITEALACGTPVAMPMHTSCGEIARCIECVDNNPNTQIIRLASEEGFTTFSNGNDARLRKRVDLAAAVEAIALWWENHHEAGLPRVRLLPQTREWLSWPRIAREMFKLLVPQ